MRVHSPQKFAELPLRTPQEKAAEIAELAKIEAAHKGKGKAANKAAAASASASCYGSSSSLDDFDDLAADEYLYPDEENEQEAPISVARVSNQQARETRHEPKAHGVPAAKTGSPAVAASVVKTTNASKRYKPTPHASSTAPTSNEQSMDGLDDDE